jgi:hypothetical protein
MPLIVLYLLKCSISLAIVWLFYQLLLRRLTFYMMNRWYLLGYAFLSFLLPLVHIAVPDEGKAAGPVQVIRYIPVIAAGTGMAAGERVFTGWDLILGMAALGALFLAIRLLVRWMSLRHIRKDATLVREGTVKVYQVDRPVIPFSFGNAIYINAKLHTEKEWEEIILHEYVHVRQRHTVDIILAEVLCIVGWFNPFSWLIRHAIRQNLEFIADAQVLASGLDRKSYQYHLLKVIGEPSYRLANNFNFSSLKKRIIMMNRSKSTRAHMMKFLFIVPLLGVLLVAFRDKVTVRLPMIAEKGSKTITVQPAPKDTVPAKTKPATVVIRSNDPSGAKPMIVIDEVEATDKQMHAMSPNIISAINVLKDSTAAGMFGPRAKGGVILVYTKGYMRTNKVRLKDGSIVPVELNNPDSTRSVSVGPGSADQDEKETLPGSTKIRLSQASVIVDGVERPYDGLAINPAKMESITVVPDPQAIYIYGAKRKKGAAEMKAGPEELKGQPKILFDSEGNKVTVQADTVIPRRQ